MASPEPTFRPTLGPIERQISCHLSVSGDDEDSWSKIECYTFFFWTQIQRWSRGTRHVLDGYSSCLHWGEFGGYIRCRWFGLRHEGNVDPHWRIGDWNRLALPCLWSQYKKIWRIGIIPSVSRRTPEHSSRGNAVHGQKCGLRPMTAGWARRYYCNHNQSIIIHSGHTGRKIPFAERRNRWSYWSTVCTCTPVKVCTIVLPPLTLHTPIRRRQQKPLDSSGYCRHRMATTPSPTWNCDDN